MRRRDLMFFLCSVVLAVITIFVSFQLIVRTGDQLVQDAARYATETSNEDVAAHLSHMQRDQFVGLLELYDRKTSVGDTATLENEPEYLAVDQTVRHLLGHTRIIEVKVFASDGFLVYSTNRRGLGADYSDSPEVERALRGRPTSSIEAHDEGFGDSIIVSSYHGLRDGSRRIRGVIEIYADRTQAVDLVSEKITQAKSKLFLIFVGIAFFCLTPFAFAVFFKTPVRNEEDI